MKSQRRNILIALMVITAMTVTGFTASFAAEGTQGNIIDRIELANDVKPVEGAVPAEPQVPADAQYSVEDYGWYVTSGTSVPMEGNFKAGEVYALGVILAPNEGYKISENPAVPAPDGCIKTEYEPLIDDMIAVMYTFPLEDENYISKARLLDVDAPYLGEHPDYEYTLPEGAGYHVAEGMYKWWQMNKDGMSGMGMGTADVYKEDYMYKLKVYFEPDEGKHFSNASTAEPLPGFDSVKSSYNEDTGRLCVEYSAPAKARSPIETIDLTGLEAIEAGDTPKELKIPESDKYRLNRVEWEDLSVNDEVQDPHMGPDDTFLAGGEYELKLSFKEKTGYVFNEEGDVKVVPASLEDNIVRTGQDRGGTWMILLFSIPEQTDPEGPTDPNGPTDPSDTDDQAGSDQNVNDEETADGDQVQTGDESSMMPWILLMAGALAGAAVILRKRHQN